MARTNESLIREWVRTGDAGQLDAFEEYLDEEVVVHAPLGFSSRGVDAEKRAWARARSTFRDLRHDVQEVLSVGSTVAARVVVTGTQEKKFAGIAPSGRTFTVDQAIFAHVGQGKIVEVWEIVDGASLKEQLQSPSE